MPQMSPMDWFMLMLFFLVIYLMFLVNLYFMLKLNFNSNFCLNFNLKVLFLNKWY